jgi:hypothetical protein
VRPKNYRPEALADPYCLVTLSSLPSRSAQGRLDSFAKPAAEWPVWAAKRTARINV